MSKNETDPFKIIPVILRERLHELTGNEYKVWSCLYLHTDKTSESYPSNETICKEAGISPRTLVTVKQGLRKKGWIVSTQRYRDNGSLSTMNEKVAVPPICIDCRNTTAKVADIPLQELQVSSLQKLQEPEVDTVEVDTLKSDTSKPQNLLRKKDSEGVAPLASLDGAITDRADAQNSKPEDFGLEANQEQNQNRSYEDLTEEEAALLKELSPLVLKKNAAATNYWIRRTIEFMQPIRVNLVYLLKFNRTHKRGALVIRNAKQFYDSCLTAHMANEWLTHPNTVCKTCKDAGLGWLKPEQKQRPANPGCPGCDPKSDCDEPCFYHLHEDYLTKQSEAPFEWRETTKEERLEFHKHRTGDEWGPNATATVNEALKLGHYTKRHVDAVILWIYANVPNRPITYEDFYKLCHAAKLREPKAVSA
jgi:hypothetical protein